MLTLGVDLASQPAATAACAIEWDAGRARVRAIDLGLDDNALVDRATDAGKVGIDAPFGWPAPFVELIRRHHGGLPMAGSWTWDNHQRDALRFRRTDHLVRALLNRWPLSVSTDLIAVPALRCAGLLDRLGVTDRSGRGPVIEVYPALALARWGFPSNGLKGASGCEARSAVLARLAADCPWLDLDAPIRARCERTDHAFDALIASLVARAAALGLTAAPSAADADHARLEGWIAVPTTDALAHLLLPPIEKPPLPCAGEGVGGEGHSGLGSEGNLVEGARVRDYPRRALTGADQDSPPSLAAETR